MDEPVYQAGAFGHATWHASTQCANGTCVEVAFGEDGVALRDGKDRAGPILVFSSREWQAFTDGVRAGEFDLLS
jgi:hypothetical protein